MSASADKQRLRRSLRAKRRAMPTLQRRLAAARTGQRLAATPEFRRARRVAVFLAADGEADPAAIIRLCVRHRKSLYLPCLRNGSGLPLAFVHYRPGQPLRRNRFGIPEPAQEPARMLLPARLDLVVMPLVGFDPRGGRLGMGGGFYDRTFAFVRDGWRGRRPCLAGLAWELQRLDRLPLETGDVPLDMVVTEKRLYRP